MGVKQELLDILACPTCKGDIAPDDTGNWLICNACRVKYEVRDDIPIMLPEEAVPLDE